MEKLVDDHSGSGLDLLEERIKTMAGQLAESKKQNEALKEELTSLQSILRSCKFPVSGSDGDDAGDVAEKGYSFEDKVQIKQKLLLILQKIDIELRKGASD